MINIYQYPTEKSPTLGLTFLEFGTEQFGVHHYKYSNLLSALSVLNDIRKKVILMNLETFCEFCEMVIDPTQIVIESIKAIQDIVKDSLEDNDKDYKKILLEIQEAGSFMKNLIKASSEVKMTINTSGTTEKVANIFMAATIIGYCKEELKRIE